ncbi:MAG: Ppx/GppA phosphatase family protein, partial [Ignavibacteria bacterium]|nr:Ppx/GppA phosphatase family protein [Ignavibacteria bacterium]
MKIAVIDIGTNTVLLLIAQFDANGHITPLVYEQRVPRLGKAVDAQKNLQVDSMARVVEVLEEYKKIMSQFELVNTIVCATSAVRDAQNKEQFAELIQQRVGLDLEILDGEEEALWTYRGAISGLPGISKATVIDIGGGSTEITTGDQHNVTNSISLDIGSVRMTERWFEHDPPLPVELDTAAEKIKTELANIKNLRQPGSTLVGVAGTATSLAILDQGHHEFSIGAVTQYQLTRDSVHSLLTKLKGMRAAEIRKLSAVMEGRADIIIAGALILSQVMTHYKFDEMVVSERGVRYGLA